MSELFDFHRCVSSLDTGTGYCLNCLSFTSVSFHWVPGCPRHLPLVFVTRQMKPVVERDSIQEHPILSTGTQMFSGGIFWRKISEENYIKLLLAVEKTNFLDFWTITEHKKGLACWIIGGFFENWGWSHLHLDHIAQGDPVGESARCVGGSERTFCPPVLCREGPHPLLWAHARYGSTLLLQTLWTLDKDTWSPDIYLTSQCDVDTLSSLRSSHLCVVVCLYNIFS